MPGGVVPISSASTGTVAGGTATGGAAGGTATGGAAGAASDPAGDAPVGGTDGTGARGLRHPGLLTGLLTLKAIKQHVENGDEPWATELGRLRARAAARRLHTPPSDRKIFCGSYNQDENGNKILECDYAVENGIDAYSLALLGYLTDDASMSDEAIRFILAWADNFQGFDAQPRVGAQGNNALLQAGWTAPWFANAAELLRYTYLGWTPNHTQRASALLNVLLPQVSDETAASPANWLHSRIEAHLAIAIFLDDITMVKKAAAQWQANTPSYFYIASDAQMPPKPNRPITPGSLDKLWDTPTYIAGLTMETCRDLGHQQLGVRSVFNSLAMAHTQGLDLLTGTDIRQRLTTFLEEQAKWMVAKTDPVGACNEPIIVQDGTRPTYMDQAEPVPYETGYALLYTSSEPLPNARAAILARPSTGASRWVEKWETLTHHFEPPK